MGYIVLDIEADGPIPGPYSMVSFGAVIVEPSLKKTFYGMVHPISDIWVPEALAVSGITRAQHLRFADPFVEKSRFKQWLLENSKGKPVFVSDNLAFDWMWICWYFHKYLGENPFGHSGRRIGDLYCGMKKDAGVNGEWKRKFRKTKHSHNPVEDALGNAEALLEFQKLGLKIKFV